MPELVAQPFRNVGLFKDHYLAHRVPGLPDFWFPSEEEMAAAYQRIWQVLSEFKATWSRRPPNEEQTEDDLIVHVLDALGFERIPQTDAKRQGESHWPDYTLFPDLVAKQRAARHTGRNNRRFYEHALTIVEAKRWGRKLDSADRADPEHSRENPSQQIVRYLGAMQALNGPLWGILTDGKRWRLYYQLVDDRSAQFYEVDLESVCTGDYERDRDGFRFFYYLFRRDAFVTHPRASKKFLDLVREEGEAHSHRLEEDLKGRVFERIFLYLAKGFIYYRRHEMGIAGPETREELAEVFGGTLILLYRLLFLLHAEDRELLPVLERGPYYGKSLTRLKFAVAQRAVTMDEPLGENAYEIWERLQTLFAAMKHGRPEWNVPRYNGGLFSDRGQHNEFLEGHRIPDDFLTAALYHLCSDEDKSTSEADFIDYADLDVRQLGSIYEGLLEFHLEWADRDLVVIKQNADYIYRDASEVTPARPGRRGTRTYGGVSQGELYLVNDRRERRATGTVFTPAYIVSHIVEKTVGPALSERLSRAEEFLAEQPEASGNAVLEAVLGLRILDPAMGSGHFLVRSLDHLSDRIAEWLAAQPVDNPLIAMVERIRGAVLASLSEQGMSEEFISSAEERLTDNNLLKRLLMKKCVYGVDYNPMAVELAKLSLWLSSFTVGAPLSFLDHHLRCGNSLVGARWDTLVDTYWKGPQGAGQQTGQLNMDDVFFEPVLDAAHDMVDLSSLSDSSFEEVERSADLFAHYYERIRPYREMGDLWVSQFFGTEMPRDGLRIWGGVIGGYLLGKRSSRGDAPARRGPSGKSIDGWTEYATGLASVPWKRLFHWELEFPEVYFEGNRPVPDAGFDVVLGNPPYVKYQNRDDTEEFKRWYKERFTSAHGNYDVYVLFVEQALRLLRPGGRHGYIVYNKWVVSDYGRKLRGLLAERRAVSELVDFADNQLFPGHTTYTCLLFTEDSEHDTLRYTRVPLLGNEREVAQRLPLVLEGLEKAWSEADDGAAATSKLGEELQSLQLQEPVQTDDFDQEDFSDEPWEFAFGPARALRKKVKSAGTPLLSLTRDGDTIFQGLITSADSVYIVHKVEDVSEGLVRVRSDDADAELTLDADLLRPLVSGEDVERYAFLPTPKLILFPYQAQDDRAHLMSPAQLSRHPGTWRYLRSHEQRLRGRESADDDADGGQGRDRPFDDDAWYRYGRQQALDKQGLPKLCVAQTVTKLEVALDFEGLYCTHNVRVNSIVLPEGTPRDTYLYFLALLNSRLLDWFFKTSPIGRHAQGHYAANRQFIKGLPIYTPGDSTQRTRRGKLPRDFRSRYKTCKTGADLAGFCLWCDGTFLRGESRSDDVARGVLVWLVRRVVEDMQTKQEERGGFLHWLSGQLGAGWEDLSGSTNLARYDEHEFDEFWDILGQPANVRRYKTQAQRGFRRRARSLREAVEREHADSVDKLRRRQTALDRDQRLIDHIVYRLYGLTDDEIAIVEAGP